MNRTAIVAVIVIAVLALLGYSLYSRKAAQAPGNATTTVAPATDAPSDIDQELSGIETGAGLDAELESTDADIERL